MALSALQPGMTVTLSGLKGAPHLNGLTGQVLGQDLSSGRWRVDLGEVEGVKALKPENLVASDVGLQEEEEEGAAGSLIGSLLLGGSSDAGAGDEEEPSEDDDREDADSVCPEDGPELGDAADVDGGFSDALPEEHDGQADEHETWDEKGFAAPQDEVEAEVSEHLDDFPGDEEQMDQEDSQPDADRAPVSTETPLRRARRRHRRRGKGGQPPVPPLQPSVEAGRQQPVETSRKPVDGQSAAATPPGDMKGRPSNPGTAAGHDYANLSVKELKQQLTMRGVRAPEGVKEKSELIELVKKAEKLPQREEPPKAVPTSRPEATTAKSGPSSARPSEATQKKPQNGPRPAHGYPQPWDYPPQSHSQPMPAYGYPPPGPWGPRAPAPWGFQPPPFGYPLPYGYPPMPGFGPAGPFAPPMHGPHGVPPGGMPLPPGLQPPPAMSPSLALILPKSREEAAARVDERLQRSGHDEEMLRNIKQFVRDHKLCDELHLGMRMLAGNTIRSIITSSAFERHLRHAADPNDTMLQELQRADPEAAGIIQVLRGGREKHRDASRSRSGHRSRRRSSGGSAGADKRHLKTDGASRRRRSRRRRSSRDGGAEDAALPGPEGGPQPPKQPPPTAPGWRGDAEMPGRSEQARGSRAAPPRGSSSWESAPGVWGEPAPAPDDRAGDKLKQWLLDLDGGRGALERYFKPLKDRFGTLEALAKTLLSKPLSSSVVGKIDPSLWETVGVEALGHRLLFAKGIVALSAQ